MKKMYHTPGIGNMCCEQRLCWWWYLLTRASYYCALYTIHLFRSIDITHRAFQIREVEPFPKQTPTGAPSLTRLLTCLLASSLTRLPYFEQPTTKGWCLLDVWIDKTTPSEPITTLHPAKHRTRHNVYLKNTASNNALWTWSPQFNKLPGIESMLDLFMPYWGDLDWDLT